MYRVNIRMAWYGIFNALHLTSQYTIIYIPGRMLRMLAESFPEFSVTFVRNDIYSMHYT